MRREGRGQCAVLGECGGSAGVWDSARLRSKEEIKRESNWIRADQLIKARESGWPTWGTLICTEITASQSTNMKR